jgi:hypothetical protein
MMKTIEDILYFDKSPLRPDKRGEDYYRPEYRKLGTVNEAFDAHYQISFDAPRVSTKVLYYERLINNAITTELNKLLTDEQLSGNRVLFIRKKLYGSIYGYLSDIKDIINKYDLDLDALLITKDYSKMLQQNECTYIFHYLILSLIRCYMEFQQHFIEYIEEDKQESIEYFFVQVLQRSLPTKVGITKIPHIEVPLEAKAEPSQKKKKVKTPNAILSFKYDCTPGKRLDNIKAFYEELVDRKLISKDEPYPNFKHLLLGEEVKTPIKWIGGKSELVYLFRYLVNEKAVLHPSEGYTIWDVVVHCFVDKDGNCYDNLNLGGQQKPCAKRITKLEDIANKTLL